MKCPICSNVDRVMSERQGVEIDYCPSCRGIWLDRGELDKIIDKAVSNDAAAGSPQNQPQSRDFRYKDQKEYHHYRKKHWLSDLFD